MGDKNYASYVMGCRDVCRELNISVPVGFDESDVPSVEGIDFNEITYLQGQVASLINHLKTRP